MSKYETMRTDPSNWKLGIVYCCAQDPRIIVRQRMPIGWTWNFAHARVIPAILIAVFMFLSPAAIGWWLGIRSTIVLGLATLLALIVIMVMASWLAKDPQD